MWSWLRIFLVAIENSPRVPDKWVSLRSRIRGGQDYLTDKGATAAQFLTLRLILIGSTHAGCDDSDGPGHAPRYLDVRLLVGFFSKTGLPDLEMAVAIMVMRDL